MEEEKLNLQNEPIDSNENNLKETNSKKSFRDSIYGRMDVSVQTMDKVILVLFGLLIACIVIGVII